MFLLCFTPNFFCVELILETVLNSFLVPRYTNDFIHTSTSILTVTIQYNGYVAVDLFSSLIKKCLCTLTTSLGGLGEKFSAYVMQRSSVHHGLLVVVWWFSWMHPVIFANSFAFTGSSLHHVCVEFFQEMWPR
jgi:hypothetical protein